MVKLDTPTREAYLKYNNLFKGGSQKQILKGENMPKKTRSPTDNEITICEFFTVRLNDLKGYIDTKFDAADVANRLARENVNTRLDSMNEFRMQLKDQAANFITRAEHDALITKYDADVRFLREETAKAAGKASQQDVGGARMIGYVGILIAVVSLIMAIVMEIGRS
jgi:hypothetical protein